jgi:hypothetical protein
MEGCAAATGVRQSVSVPETEAELSELEMSRSRSSTAPSVADTAVRRPPLVPTLSLKAPRKTPPKLPMIRRGGSPVCPGPRRSPNPDLPDGPSTDPPPVLPLHLSTEKQLEEIRKSMGSLSFGKGKEVTTLSLSISLYINLRTVKPPITDTQNNGRNTINISITTHLETPKNLLPSKERTTPQ